MPAVPEGGRFESLERYRLSQATEPGPRRPVGTMITYWVLNGCAKVTQWDMLNLAVTGILIFKPRFSTDSFIDSFGGGTL
jgi:hypothetical protein